MSKNYSNGSIPSQITNKKRSKNDKLAKETVDALEQIAFKQIKENKKFKDYYDMVEGKLVWADYSDEDFTTLDAVSRLQNEDVETKTFVKHYDILGMFVNQCVGEWISNQDDFDIDCVDTYTDNEFIRERSKRLQSYIMEMLDIERMKALAENGINPQERREFKSEEEKQQYEQIIQEIINSVKSPEQIDREMRSWKTEAVSWANGTKENDDVRFRMENLYREEMTDYCLTGRYFRNYYIGFDYYKPERWETLDVFFSRESDAVKPQDREFVGRQISMPPYKVRERYGHKLNEDELKRIDNYTKAFTSGRETIDLTGKGGLMRAILPQNELLPFYNYPEFEQAYEVQEVFDEPMGVNLVQTTEGVERQQYYLPDYLGQYRGLYGAQRTRNDYEVRKDQIVVTEGYYRSYKKVYIANFKNADGIYVTETFSDELLPEFIEKHGLKKSKSSLEDIMKELEGDKIYTQHQPVIRSFVKINVSDGKNEEAIYIDDEMPFQIKGNGEFSDVIIPVGGIIDSVSIAQKIRPFQVNYNINLNQIISFMEKELGMFWAFDINLIPSEFKDQGDTEEALLRIQELIKTTAMVPLDYSKGNTGYSMPQSNSLAPQQASFANDITQRMNWAEFWKNKAIEQLGFTPQRLGSPNQYETAEGVRQGVEASYAQTANIFSKMTQSYLETMEVHLAVAQYCQKNYLDADFVYTRSDNTRGFIHLSDPAFPLRRFGVFPINSSKNKLQRQQLIQTLLSTNTLGADILDYAEVITSKSTQEILERAQKSRAKREAEAREAQERQLENDRLIAETNDKLKRDEMEFRASENQKNRETEIIKAQLNALGRASYTEGTVEEESINEIAQKALEEQQAKSEMENKQLKTKSDIDVAKKKLDIEKERNEIKRLEIEQKREASKNELEKAAINYKQ